MKNLRAVSKFQSCATVQFFSAEVKKSLLFESVFLDCGRGTEERKSHKTENRFVFSGQVADVKSKTH